MKDKNQKAKPKKKFKKSSDIIVSKRVQSILEAILEGGNTHEIISHYSSEFKVSARQIHTYISKANAIFAEYAITEAKSEIGKSLNRMNKLFNKSMQIMDFKTCLAIQKEINSLLHLGDINDLKNKPQSKSRKITLNLTKK